MNGSGHDFALFLYHVESNKSKKIYAFPRVIFLCSPKPGK